MTEAKITLLPEVVDDLRRLDGAARKVAAAGIEKLRTDPHLRGAPLGSRATSDLTGLRKLVVGNRTYRIVYRVHENNTVVVLWVVGKRAEREAYETARARVELYADNPAKKAILTQILDAVRPDPD